MYSGILSCQTRRVSELHVTSKSPSLRDLVFDGIVIGQNPVFVADDQKSFYSSTSPSETHYGFTTKFLWQVLTTDRAYTQGKPNREIHYEYSEICVL